MKLFLSALCGCAVLVSLCGISLGAQTIASSIVGTVVDPSGAVIPGAKIHLVARGTDATRDTQSDRDGVFHFPNLDPGVYNETVTAAGFKQNVTANIQLSASETRDMGRIALAIGSAVQTVTVTAEASPIQTSSSEVSHTVAGEDIETLPVRGRDLFDSVHLDSGVLDTAAPRETTGHSVISGISIDGNTSNLNFSVDGQTDMDIGSNGSVQVEPNMDSIQEIKVLSSNYQAEYGRNSGGSITVITKSGTTQYHGTGWWTHRHEEFNANDFFHNETGLPRSLYRYNIAGWSFGGPINIKSFKNKLFFFASQEYTNQLGNNVTEDVTVPTALEESGDFSQTLSPSGQLIKIINPATGLQFPGNQISDINPVGQAMLEFFPQPNFTPAAGSEYYNQANFTESASGFDRRRNDMTRIDYDSTDKLTMYFRWVHDSASEQELFPFTQFNIAPTLFVTPGSEELFSTTYVLSPTVINEASVSYGNDQYTFDITSASEAQVDRSVLGANAPPTLLPLPTTPPPSCCDGDNGYYNLLPQMSFGSAQANMVSLGNPDYNLFSDSPTWQITDNLSKVSGNHQFKFGIYVDWNGKVQAGTQPYQGDYSFANDANDPDNSGDGYANALLGNFDSFTQTPDRSLYNVPYWNVEWYAEDNWRATRKLTLDLGVRFYHQTPFTDTTDGSSVFVPSLYNSADAARIYTPACSVTYTGTCPSTDRMATDPGGPAGNLAPVAYVGDVVPGSGSYADGMEVLGQYQVPLQAYNQTFLAAAPRLGFAYDVFGNGKTALRGGFGTFYNRIDGNEIYTLSGQAPTIYTYDVAYGNIGTLNDAVGVVAPSTVHTFPNHTPWPMVMNGSFGIQEELPFQTALSVEYVGNFSRDQPIDGLNLNPIPLGADFADVSSVTGTALTEVGSSLERTAYPGYQDIEEEDFVGHSNYNALQVSLQHRLTNGFLLGVAYSWAKNLGITAVDPLVPNNNTRNYGPLSTDRGQTLIFNYSYALPGVGNVLLGSVLNHWTFSGLTTFDSGAPFEVTYNGNGVDFTGSGSESARINVVSNPFQNVPAKLILNPNAFSIPIPADEPGGSKTESLGNLGDNPYSYPAYQEWDMTMEKFVPVAIGMDRNSGFRVQVEAFNAFNHPEFTAFGITTTSPASFGLPTGDTPGPRVMSLNVRFEF